LPKTDLKYPNYKKIKIFKKLEFGVNFEKLFAIKDADGNTILMELAKNMKDDALREILTNSSTVNYITHSVATPKNFFFCVAKSSFTHAMWI
jgi:hypothetical protein